ncbi:MAG: hypothetical protein NT027_11725, partial [Proteobacteria bacterium]|nr:hypothetical protein [Pseudomonadota bacterium]
MKISSASKHQKIGTYSQKGIDIEQSTIRRGKLTLHYRIEKSLIGQEVILRRCEANSAIPDHIRGHVIAGNFAQQSYCKRSEEISPTSCGQKLACFSTSCTEYKFRPQQEEDSVEFNILNLNKLREGTLNDLILYEPKSMRTSAIESREDVHPIEAIETGGWDGSCFAIDPYSSLWNTNPFFTNGSLYIVRQKNCTEESMILTKSCPESTSSTKRTILDQIIHFNKGEDLKMMPVSPQE